MAADSPFARLPLRLYEHVFSYLTLAELNAAAAVSRRWLGIAVAETAKSSRRDEVEREFAEQCRTAGVGWLRMLEPARIDLRASFGNACAGGNLAVAEWLIRSRKGSWQCWREGMQQAIKHGRLDALRWLKRTYVAACSKRFMKSLQLHERCVSRKVQRWLNEHCGLLVAFRQHDGRASTCLDLTQWYADRYDVWHRDIAQEAAAGHYDAARWLVEQFGPPPGRGATKAQILHVSCDIGAAWRLINAAYGQAPGTAVWGAYLGEAASARWLERRCGKPPTGRVAVRRTADSAAFSRVVRWATERSVVAHEP